MYQKLKTEIKEIVEIVNQCPEALQQKCFELLLENFLNSNNALNSNKNETKIISSQTNTTHTPSETEETSNDEIEISEEEIQIKNFHVKVQRFLGSNNININDINNIYYKEDNKLMPLYDTLKTTNMSECQVRLALLTAFENSFNDVNGEMVFNYEVVRNRCSAMKCYNSANFARYFKNNIQLWDNLPDKPDKNSEIALSVEGKKELAKVLLDLSKGE